MLIPLLFESWRLEEPSLTLAASYIAAAASASSSDSYISPATISATIRSAP